MALERLHAAPHITLRLGVTATAEEQDDCVLLRFGNEAARARLAFDTRPPRRLGAYGLTQRFAGWEIETQDEVFDPAAVTLMDFRCGQTGAAHFTYVLPSSARRALVEDTWFAPPGFQPPDHDTAIRDYLRARYGVTRFEIIFKEHGALPMDPVFRPATGRRLLPMGLAGGGARPSTGYAFNAIQRQCDTIAVDLRAGRLPLPVRPRPGMVRLMDSVLLDMLARQPELAAALFASLFDQCNPAGLVRFLNDRASLLDLAAVGVAMPFKTTSLATIHLLLDRTAWARPAIAG